MVRPDPMSEKNSFLNWVGFKSDENNEPNSVDRIRELEAQLADLRSRRDITSLSKEEFEILATETAMSMVKSAQLRESKAQSTADRVTSETLRTTKEAIEGADQRAKSILASAEIRSKKYIQAAESDALELLEKTEQEAESLLETKKRESTQLTTAARREGERVISEAVGSAAEYRHWLANVISEAERLYKIQKQSLDAAEGAIHQSRTRLESAFLQLAQLQKNVLDNLNPDDTLIKSDPIKVSSERRKPVLDAPGEKIEKKVVKRATAKRK